MLQRYVQLLSQHYKFINYVQLQVLRALNVSLNNILKNGVENENKTVETDMNGTKKRGKQNPDAFDDESWAGSVQRFWDGAEHLNADKWERIYMASESFIPNIPKAGAGPALKEFARHQGRSEFSEAGTAASSDADASRIVISD